MNLRSSLLVELGDKAYRDAYVESQIRMGLPFQVRALRLAQGWTQGDLAKHAGMSQPRIAEIEKPRQRRFNLDTLLRIASAFDVGLEVRFVPISQIIDHAEDFDPDAFEVPSFHEEIALAERAEVAKGRRKSWFGADYRGLRQLVVAGNETGRQIPDGGLAFSQRQGDLISRANISLVNSANRLGVSRRIPPQANVGVQNQQVVG